MWLSAGRLVLGFAVGGATQTAPMYVAELSSAGLQGTSGPVLPNRHRSGRSPGYSRRGLRVDLLAGANRACLHTGSDHAAAVAAPTGKSALVGQARWSRGRASCVAAGSSRRLRRGCRAGRSDRTRAPPNARPAPVGGVDCATPGCVRPLVLGCGIAVFTQLSGIEMIIYYSPSILTDVGVYKAMALQVSVGLAAAYLISQLVGLTIIDRVGRRRLTPHHGAGCGNLSLYSGPALRHQRQRPRCDALRHHVPDRIPCCSTAAGCS